MGFRGKYKNKRDGNEAEIIARLRAHGLSVYPMDTPADLLVGWDQKTWLVEVKMPKAKLSGPQEAFYADWKGNKTILRSVEDATAFAQAIRNGTEND